MEQLDNQSLLFTGLRPGWINERTLPDQCRYRQLNDAAWALARGPG
jgi:hypothetical protein